MGHGLAVQRYGSLRGRECWWRTCDHAVHVGFVPNARRLQRQVILQQRAAAVNDAQGLALGHALQGSVHQLHAQAENMETDGNARLMGAFAAHVLGKLRVLASTAAHQYQVP